MAQRPKFNPPANIPVTVKLEYVPQESKESQYGEYWMYTVSVDKIEHVWFADNDIQGQLSAFAKGDSLTIVKREKIAEKSGKTYFVWEINQAVFENSGRVAKAAPDLTKKDDLDSYRNRVKNALYTAITDVLEVQGQLIGPEGYRTDLFNPETVQKYATVIMIDYLKRT